AADHRCSARDGARHRGNGDRDLGDAAPTPLARGVRAVDRVAEAVVVGGGRAAGYRVDLQEPPEVGCVEADADEDDAAEGLAGAPFAAEPAVARCGLAADLVAELVGVVEGRRG